jgi:endonuclease III
MSYGDAPPTHHKFHHAKAVQIAAIIAKWRVRQLHLVAVLQMHLFGETPSMASPTPASKTKNTAARPVDQAAAKKHAGEIVRWLRRTYPNAHCALDFTTPLELLVATILSAQCTDVRVNIVTKDLFRKYRSAADYARATIAELEKDIQSTGFFRNKAKSIQNCCRLLAEQYDGQVPQSIEQLVELPGIGRKTANVVLGTAFGIASGVVVDTHVTRLSNRMGLSRHKDAEKIEKDLMAVIPRKEWVLFSHRMIQHGRQVCIARKPKCEACALSAVCPKIGVQK